MYTTELHSCIIRSLESQATAGAQCTWSYKLHLNEVREEDTKRLRDDRVALRIDTFNNAPIMCKQIKVMGKNQCVIFLSCI